MVDSIIFGIMALLAMLIANLFFYLKKDHLAFLAGGLAVVTSLLSVVSTLFFGTFLAIAYQIMILAGNYVPELWFGITIGIFLFFSIAVGPVVSIMALGPKTEKEYFFLVVVFYASTGVHLFLLP